MKADASSNTLWWDRYEPLLSSLCIWLLRSIDDVFRCALNLRFHQIHDRCVTAPIWFCSAVHHPATPTSCVLSLARYGRQLACFILKSNRMSYCWFDAWLPVCLVLNSAELLHRASTRYSDKYISPAYLLESSGLPELGWSRYAVQWTWWKRTLKWNLSALLAWWRHNTADTYLVESQG